MDEIDFFFFKASQQKQKPCPILNLAKEKQLQNFSFLVFGACVCVTFKCLFPPPQPVLVKQKHVFSWRGSPEAALPEWRAGDAEVTAARVQASPVFWQELESSLFGVGGGVDCGQLASPACVACFSSVSSADGNACSQKEEQAIDMRGVL